ncbi:MAG TPA: ADOP family duplicated permease [Thermoanaerobaculia bacterium]|nr:ADOP family duplicated permease [Thermoanaerobaculia bacterium]
MEALVLDLRHAARRLTRGRGGALLAVLTVSVAVSIGVATWSAVHGVLLAPLPYRAADRLVMLWERHEEKGIEHRVAAPARFTSWRENARSFSEMVAYQTWTEMTLSAGGEAEVAPVIPVTSDFLSFLGLSPAHGRDLAAEDAEGEGRRVALLGHRVWQRRFAGDPAVVGSAIRLQGEPWTVVGILPEEARIAGVLPLGAEATPGEEILVPLAGVAWEARVYGALQVVGRLAEGVGLDQARAELDVLAAALALEHPGTDEGWSVEVVPLRDEVAGAFGPVLTLLLAAVLAVHLLACSNLAGLFLSRAIARSRETAVRAALGASRARVRRLALLEGALVAGAGAALGLAVAAGAGPLLGRVASTSLPLGARFGLAPGALAVAVAMAVATAVLVGGPAALASSRAAIPGAVRGAGLAAGERGRRLLVIAQVALATVLLLGAALTVRSLLDLRAIEPGFEPERVLTLRVDLPRWRYEDGAARRGALRGLLDELGSLPGVETIGAVNQAPLGRVSDSFRLWLAGRGEQRPIDLPTAEIRTFAGDYFETLGVAVLRGRIPADLLAEGGAREVVVNAPLARTLWPGADPLGRLVGIDGPEGPWLEVVGVVSEVRHFGLERAAPPELWVPYRLVPWPSVVLALRGDAPAALVEPAIARMRGFDPELAAYDVATLSARLSQSLAPRRLPAMLLGLFGAGGALVAGLGLYALLAFGVTARGREIGLRLAVGARPGDLVRQFLGSGLRLVTTGVALGLGLGALALPLGRRWLGELGALDPWSVVGVAALGLAVGIAAALGPALRAARHDPARVLRAE